MKKIGLIINPVAGMGGSVGLKGTDHVVEEALRRGAVPGSEKRAETALRELLPYKDELLVCTGAGHMGGELARRMGFRTEVFSAGKDTGAADAPADTADTVISADLKTPADIDIPAASAFCFATAGSDTIALGKRLLNEQADLLLFAGGDGTARDIYQAVGTELVCVGIPAGVKIHSPVYAKNPGAAGKLAAMWMSGWIKRYEEKEVLDIDEDAYRSGHINTALYGYLKIPAERALTQNRKAPTPLSDEAAIESIAYEVTDHMEPDVVYLVGGRDHHPRRHEKAGTSQYADRRGRGRKWESAGERRLWRTDSFAYPGETCEADLDSNGRTRLLIRTWESAADSRGDPDRGKGKSDHSGDQFQAGRAAGESAFGGYRR